MATKDDALSATLELRQLLAGLPPGVRLSLDVAARNLGVTARTLQRRLRAEGVTFRSVLEEAALESAARTVASAATMSEASAKLGFSEPAAFHRAFKRWTGMTPRRFGKLATAASNAQSRSRS
jgi:AraC-like DNA-binding protein